MLCIKEMVKHNNPNLTECMYRYILNRTEKKEIKHKLETLNINDFEQLKVKILNFVDACKISSYSYKFSLSSVNENLYASMYACMVNDLLAGFSIDDGWCDFFDNFQDSDGFFKSKELETGEFKNGEHWGERHLAAHMIIPYAKRGRKIKHEFQYLNEYKNPDHVVNFLERADWYGVWRTSNAVMNLGVLLQYSRDYLGLDCYKDSIDAMTEWLYRKIRLATGMWHKFEVKDKNDCYEAIRGAYHIYPILFYEGYDLSYLDQVSSVILSCQNNWGGFDYSIKSTACDDIDAIGSLLRFVAKYGDNLWINKCTAKTLKWLLCNQTDEGGFVFAYNTGFEWGNCNSLICKAGEANLFATWFRLLNVLMIREYLFGEKWLNYKIPGYELTMGWRNEK